MPINRKRDCPIGVFDSGLGGLTVVKELMRQLPHEGIVYFGDTARVPYGTKSKESIIRFSQENAACLLKHKVKIIVVACNTSSSVALTTLRQKFNLPIVGVIGPGAKKAVEVTRNKRVGVIATQATINSQSYTKNIHSFNNSVKVIDKACPLFVPLVEEGWFDKKATYDVAKEYLKEIIRSRADTVILGCTHYPLIKPILQKVVGSKVTLIDSAKEVALEVKSLLKCTGLERAKKGAVERTFLVSDEPKHFLKLARRFLSQGIKNVKKI